ncbi:MAG: DUF86 domain-containing protein [Nitrospinae bacterium]|nr:DUF86 domain-containing protein [Nitrospinota bacterium]
MPDRDLTLFVKDIFTSSHKIIGYIENITLNEFLEDHKTYDAVMRNLQIIDEAIKHLPKEFRKKYKNVEWKKVAGLRDIVVHEYFGINEDIIWDVIKNKIPELKREDVPIKMIVECKKWREDRPVDIDVVRKVMYWVNEEFRSTLGMIVTTSRFTTESKK